VAGYLCRTAGSGGAAATTRGCVATQPSPSNSLIRR
jgi:hypothetical protein